MPIDWKSSNRVRNQRDLWEIKKMIEKFKERRRRLENEKTEIIRLNLSQQAIAGRIESLNTSINTINKEIDKLERDKRGIEVPKL